MNASTDLSANPILEDFPYRLTDNVRFADLDPNQHVNNAVYATYFETGRVTLMKDLKYGLMPEGLAWIMVRLDIHFRAELKWPGTIEMGLGVSKFGRTSVTFDQVVFSASALRGLVAIGLGADRRDLAPARAAHRRDQDEFRTLVAARLQAGLRFSLTPAAPASSPPGRQAHR